MNSSVLSLDPHNAGTSSGAAYGRSRRADQYHSRLAIPSAEGQRHPGKERHIFLGRHSGRRGRYLPFLFA